MKPMTISLKQACRATDWQLVDKDLGHVEMRFDGVLKGLQELLEFADREIGLPGAYRVHGLDEHGNTIACAELSALMELLR